MVNRQQISANPLQNSGLVDHPGQGENLHDSHVVLYRQHAVHVTGQLSGKVLFSGIAGFSGQDHGTIVVITEVLRALVER